MASSLSLTRETLLDDSFREHVRLLDPELQLMPVEARDASLSAVLHGRDISHGVWVFAYGSLIWNPLFHFAERRVATIDGYRRRYCLWGRLGRGTPERPGLLLGLDRGGSCSGIAFRIAGSDVASELAIIWRREMVTHAYDPQWVEVMTRAGSIEAITFVVNRNYPHYAASLSEEQIVATVATAEGRIGDCATYLFNTIEHLNQWGIHDPMLERIMEQVLDHRNAT